MHRSWRLPVAVLAAAALTALFGCSKQPVAIVNGQRITRQEFYDRLEQAGGERVLADLIARRLLSDAFTKAKLTVTPQEVDSEIAQMKKQAPDEASWQNYLKQQGMTEAQFRDFIEFNLKVKKLAEKDVKYTDADLQKFFNEHREQFARPATVVLSEIVVADKAKADELRRQLNDPKASFTTLARTNSVSAASRDRGGRRPEEPAAGIMPEAIRSAVANMQVGQISQPIKADQFWYIIKLDERHAAESADYAKIKDKVKQAYVYSKARQVPDIIEELRKTARVSILDKRYSSMQQMFGPPQNLPSFGAQGAQQGKAPAAPGAPAPAGQPAPAAPPAGTAPVAPAAPAPAGS